MTAGFRSGQAYGGGGEVKGIEHARKLQGVRDEGGMGSDCAESDGALVALINSGGVTEPG